MQRALSLGAIAVVCATIGCGRAAVTPPIVPTPEPDAPPVAVAKLGEGLKLMAAHDRANDWNDAACKETVAALLAVNAGRSAVPSYDAGLVQQRCGKDEEAKALFRAALDKDPGYAPARAALALYAGSGAELDRAIADLGRAVVESRFSSVEAQVALATLQMRRGAATADADGADDLDRARKNLHRALAIDDSSMPALNRLALWHLDRARREQATAKKAASHALELAALVCSQAIRKNPRYATIHNTLGLVEVELNNLSRASAAFDQARRLDPAFVEAQMNFAAVNLQFRGFSRAEEAYRKVLALRPNDYDARLGLSLSIRGQIDDANEATLVGAAQKELAAARQIAPDRPEAYYNEAILVKEYETKASTPVATRAALGRAKSLFGQFLAKAEKREGFREAGERARERIKEIDQIIDFLDKTPQAP
jgi:tetratricopeptide (TPR) repeat protein